MEQKQMARWLKIILIGMAMVGLLACAVVVPTVAQSFRTAYPEFSHAFWPWLIFLWCAALPCFIALGLGWKIADNIGKDRSFSMENARLMGWISWLAAGDGAYFFLGDYLLLMGNMSHPGIFLALLSVVFLAAAVSVGASVLSRLVAKAAALQEQSDFTI